MIGPVEEYDAIKSELRRKFLGKKASHQKHGEGVITLVGTSHSQVWVEVAFAEKRKVFVEPFDELKLETL